MLWYVIGVVRVPAGLASNDGDAAFGVASRQVRGKVEVEEFLVERTAVRGVGGRSGAHGEDFERGDPVKGKLGLEYGGIDAFLGALSDGSSNVVDPRPNACDERRVLPTTPLVKKFPAGENLVEQGRRSVCCAQYTRSWIGFS